MMNVFKAVMWTGNALVYAGATYMATDKFLSREIICARPELSPGLMGRALGGAQSIAKEVFEPFGKTAIAVTATLAAAGAVLVIKRRRVKQVCDEYVMQLKEKLGGLSQEPSREVREAFVLESIRDNSREQKMVRPKCQILVGKINGSFEIYGSAFRVWDSLIVPTHVLTSAMDDNERIWFKGSQGVLPLDYSDFQVLDTDVSFVNLNTNQFSRIGCPQVTLHERLVDQGEFVNVCGVLGNGTVGKLTHDYTTFGKVMYHGSTVAGYSGAPYMKGPHVVGMHCWGGRVNGGYSASYLKVLLQQRNGTRLEDSSEWVFQLVKSKKLRKSDVYIIAGNDEVQIRHNGQYHLISGEDWRRSKGLDWYNDQYDDSESTEVEPESLRHSGESNALIQPGVSGNSSQPGDLELLVEKALTKRFSELSNKQLLNLKRSAVSPNKPKTTSGLLSQENQK